jgi:cell wall-associated NlpC family hydrolase
MNKFTTTVIAASIATSTLLAGFLTDASASTINPSLQPTVDALPPVDLNTQEEILMTALPVATTYTVAKGDTVDRIAEIVHLEPAVLKEWNNLPNEVLFTGQVLSIIGQVKPNEQLIQQALDVEAAYKEQQAAILAAEKAEAERIAKEEATKKQASSQQASSQVNDVIALAKQFLGVPYVFGGTTPSGFDCSGYISYIYKQVGKLDQHYNAAGLYSISTKVSEPQVGDLVFFSGTYKAGISHVGIYLGDNQMINASGKQVQISKINDSYWGAHFTGFGRI